MVASLSDVGSRRPPRPASLKTNPAISLPISLPAISATVFARSAGVGSWPPLPPAPPVCFTLHDRPFLPPAGTPWQSLTCVELLGFAAAPDGRAISAQTQATAEKIPT